MPHPSGFIGRHWETAAGRFYRGCFPCPRKEYPPEPPGDRQRRGHRCPCRRGSFPSLPAGRHAKSVIPGLHMIKIPDTGHGLGRIVGRTVVKVGVNVNGEWENSGNWITGLLLYTNWKEYRSASFRVNSRRTGLPERSAKDFSKTTGLSRLSPKWLPES